MQIYTYTSDFPKSFDISIDGKVVKSIKEATELNGKNLMMTINFCSTYGKNIRFIQTGPFGIATPIFLISKELNYYQLNKDIQKEFFLHLFNKMEI